MCFSPLCAEIDEYAASIGMSLPEDEDLLWIVQEGLRAKLPDGWRACQDTRTGEIYYFNFNTGHSVWEHPCDDKYREVCCRSFALGWPRGALC